MAAVSEVAPKPGFPPSGMPAVELAKERVVGGRGLVTGERVSHQAGVARWIP